MVKAPQAKGNEGRDQFVETASIKDMKQADVDKLMAEMADLREKLAVSERARTEVEKAALAAAESQGALMQREIQEVLTGKTVTVRRAKGYKVKGYSDGGREHYEPVWEEVELPTYFYKIDMPPVGGTDLKINGLPYYHGQVVEVDIDVLRSIKEMIYRLWDHDRNIHGSDENFYRTPQNKTLSGRGRA